MKWCEKCKDYVVCTLKDKKPKCFTPITNNAHGTPETYLAKALRFSRDNHEIAEQTEPNSSEKPNNCEDLQDWKDRMWAEAVIEPQTDCPWK